MHDEDGVIGIKNLITDFRNGRIGEKKARELLVEAIIENDYESWIDWSSKDLAEELASLHRGEPRLSDHTIDELIDIISQCADCGSKVNVKTAVEFEGSLFHKKCHSKWSSNK